MAKKIAIGLVCLLVVIIILISLGNDTADKDTATQAEGTAAQPEGTAAQAAKFTLSENEKIAFSMLITEDIEMALKGKDSLFSEMSSEDINIVTPDNLVRDYHANEVRANQQYRGKPVAITGRVDGIATGITDRPYITFKTRELFSEPQAHFSRADSDKAALVNRNQNLTLVCTGNGMVIGSPMLKDCQFFEDAVKTRVDKMMAEIPKLEKGRVKNVDEYVREMAWILKLAAISSDDFANCGDNITLKRLQDAGKNIKKFEDLSNENKEKMQEYGEYLQIWSEVEE